MSDPKKKPDGSAPGEDDEAKLRAAALAHIGEAREGVLRRRFRSMVSDFDSELTLAVIAAKNRAMTPEQRAAYTAIRVVQAGGLRPSRSDNDAWDAATSKAMAAGKSKGKGKA